MFKLEIETINDAFAENGTHELERILLRVVAQIADNRHRASLSEGVCFDSNGNRVGSWQFAMGESDDGGNA